MNQKNKILMGLTQVENLAKLVEGNQYQGFFIHHLTNVRVEFERQLNLIDGRKKTY
jgi:hypothetical protein